MLPSQPNGRATFVKAMIGSNLIAPRPGPCRDRPPRPTAGGTAIGCRQGSGFVASRRGRGSGADPWEGRIRDGSPAPNSGGRLHGSVSGDRDELHQSVRGWLACLKKGAYRHPEGLPQSGRAPFGAEPGGRAPFGAAGRHLARASRSGAIWRESRGGHLEASAGRRWEADLELNGPRRAGGPGIASGRWLRDSIGIGDQPVSRSATPNDRELR